MRTALVCGAGGFIGNHLVTRLKSEGFWVRAVDLKSHEYAVSEADDFIVGRRYGGSRICVCRGKRRRYYA